MTGNNGYQREQAAAVDKSAARLGVEAEIAFAENDSILQSQQILNRLQGPTSSRPDGVICHPVGTALTQVAKVAAQAGIGWVILNRDADYLAEFRQRYPAPMFCVTVDQEEIGRIQARQFATLVPDGGLVLYIQGTSGNFSAERRNIGLQSAKLKHLEIRTLRGNFTETGGYDAITAWLRLSTSRAATLRLVGAQNDIMAIGARRALLENSPTHWANVLFTGCDASADLGQEMIRNGSLAASVSMPTTAGIALEMMANALHTGSQPTPITVMMPASYPSLDKLAAKAN